MVSKGCPTTTEADPATPPAIKSWSAVTSPPPLSLMGLPLVSSDILVRCAIQLQCAMMVRFAMQGEASL